MQQKNTHMCVVQYIKVYAFEWHQAATTENVRISSENDLLASIDDINMLLNTLKFIVKLVSA